MGTKTGLRPEVAKRLAEIESMTLDDARKLTWKTWEALGDRSITAKEACALITAANERMKDIRRGLRAADK